jgi:hypothetical protein
MKYNVHLFTVVRVKVSDIEANTQEEAISKAENQIPFYDLFDNIPQIECYGKTSAKASEVFETGWGEEHSHALVDEAGAAAPTADDPDPYKNSRYYEPVDGGWDLCGYYDQPTDKPHPDERKKP